MERRDSAHLETALGQVVPTRVQWHAWTRSEPALAALTYRELRHELRTCCQQRKDQLLGALIRVSQRDPVAFVILAACLLPAVRSRLRRYGPSLDRDDAIAVMVEALYEAVAGHDNMQSRFVATNLLALPTRRLRRAVALEVGWSRHSCHDAPVPMADQAVELSAVAMLTEAVDAGVLTPQDAGLILETRIVGRSLPEAGRRLRLGYETVKKRRQRAEARWSQWCGASPSSLILDRHRESATRGVA
jgi:hypothetical protein